MVTVIIPALNEEGTIAQVVQLAKNSPLVSEVIVVDDKSMDNTVLEAQKVGAAVITSTRLGKGTSMKEGILVAKNEIVVFLDADIVTYPPDVVEKLTKPLIDEKADFVKSWFERQAGRVTELVAKPLLSILYPSFPNFKQPLSGMIAGKRSLFSRCEFEEGYGVDIGILIDMYNLGATIVEAGIGSIENRMRPLDQLGKMSREVAGTIIKKSRSFDLKNLETYEDIQVIRGQMEFAIRESLMSLKKIAVFEMDDTILRGSFISAAADKFGFGEELPRIMKNNNPFIRIKLLAQLLKGRSFGELLEIADSIELTPNLREILPAMKDLGYITGIISDSFSCITNHIKNKYGFDFTISNELEFSRSIATGEVTIPSLFLPGAASSCKHDYCKTNALMNVCEKYGVDLKNTFVVGGKESDACVLDHAGIGISFCAEQKFIGKNASYIVNEPDFSLLIPVID